MDRFSLDQEAMTRLGAPDGIDAAFHDMQVAGVRPKVWIVQSFTYEATNIEGVWQTEEDASRHVQRLREADAKFDRDVYEMDWFYADGPCIPEKVIA